MGPNLYVFIHDADHAEQILKGRMTISKPKVYEAISDVLGADGLFSSNGNFPNSILTKNLFHSTETNIFFFYSVVEHLIFLCYFK